MIAGNFTLYNLADGLRLLTPDMCDRTVIEMGRHPVLRLQKAGHRTRTTMEGVVIIGKNNRFHLA